MYCSLSKSLIRNLPISTNVRLYTAPFYSYFAWRLRCLDQMVSFVTCYPAGFDSSENLGKPLQDVITNINQFQQGLIYLPHRSMLECPYTRKSCNWAWIGISPNSQVTTESQWIMFNQTELLLPVGKIVKRHNWFINTQKDLFKTSRDTEVIDFDTASNSFMRVERQVNPLSLTMTETCFI